MPINPHPATNLPRRRFLKWTAAGIAACAAATPPSTAAPSIRTSRTRTARDPGSARNIIFMVSDGMSQGTLSLADMFRRQHEQRSSEWLALFARDGIRRALYSTRAADSLVVDSAAAGSCWGCGHRVNNGALNITPDGVQRLPLLVHAAQSGKATGVVTTTRVTHATPASFVVNCARRDWEGPIAAQLLDRRVDLVLGGGRRFFKSDLLAAHPDLTVVRDRAALLDIAPKGGRLLGLFAESHLPFVLDQPATVPSLAEMTRIALRRLDTAPNGFVIQIEGGRVDHAAHSNDAPSLIREQLAFDDAIAEVMRFIDGGRADDTLVILTTDHGNANPGLTVYGPEAQAGFDRLAKVTRSGEWFFDELNKLPEADRAGGAPGLLTIATGIEFDEVEKRYLADAVAAKRVAPFREQSKFESVVGGILANHFGIGFVSGNHTADYVEVTALGPGSETLAPTGHNADLHPLMVAALGLPPGKLLADMHEKVQFPKPPRPD